MLRRLAAAAATLICLGALPPAAQDLGVAQSEILVIDPERLFEETLLGARMLADHQAERETLAASNRKIASELETEEQRLTALRAETAPEAFREMADAFDARVQEIRRDSDRRARDLERERERLPLVFMRRVEPVLVEVMRAAGGLVLLDARTVLLRADAIDVTDTAIARIDRSIGDGRAPQEDGQAPPEEPAAPEPAAPETPETPAAPAE